MKYAQNRKQNNHLVKIYTLSSTSIQNVRLHTRFTISVRMTGLPIRKQRDIAYVNKLKSFDFFLFP